MRHFDLLTSTLVVEVSLYQSDMSHEIYYADQSKYCCFVLSLVSSLMLTQVANTSHSDVKVWSLIDHSSLIDVLLTLK